MVPGSAVFSSGEEDGEEGSDGELTFLTFSGGLDEGQVCSLSTDGVEKIKSNLMGSSRRALFQSNGGSSWPNVNCGANDEVEGVLGLLAGRGGSGLICAMVAAYDQGQRYAARRQGETRYGGMGEGKTGQLRQGFFLPERYTRCRDR